MEEILNSIVAIAKDIEKNVFSNYDSFVKDTLEQTNNSINEFCNTLAKDEFAKVSSIKALVSKNDKKIVSLNDDGKYIISFVDIDNIELLDLNFSLGTIFGIYEGEIESSNLVASCYVTYGPTFQYVLATKENGVQFFSWDGKEFKEQESFKLDQKGKINSTGGDVTTFTAEHKALVQALFDDGYRLRFSNSLALDTHQILFKRGGLYSSPKTTKDLDGTLELVFEALPICFIIELAGGESYDGKNSILEIKVDDNLSKKTPVYFGSKSEMEKVKNIF